MTFRIRTRASWAILVTFLILVAIVAGLSESYYERREASKLVNMLSDVQVGYTTEADARQIMQEFSRFCTYRSDKNDAGIESYDSCSFNNFAYAFLHISPRKFVSVVVSYRNGVVSEKSAQYIENPRCSGIVIETARQPGAKGQDGTKSKGRSRNVYLSSSVPSPIFIMQITDDLDVPLARRQLDWKIDLSCMTTIGGCRDPRKVLYGALLENGLADAADGHGTGDAR